MLLGIVPLFEIGELADIIVVDGSVDFSRFRYVDLVKKSYDMGFRHVEITGDLMYIIPGSITGETVRELIGLKEELGISFTVHLPIWSVELASPNNAIRKASIQSILDTINLFEDLEPIYYVLHATGALASEFSRFKGPSFVKNMVNRYMQSFAAESLEAIIDESGVNSKKFAVEDVEFPWDLTYELIEEFNTSICYDTGHLHSGQPGFIEPLEFLEKHMDRIVELHLHDAVPRKPGEPYEWRDHLPLGEGSLPYCKLLRKLIEKNFQGPIVFELSTKNVKMSLIRIKEDCPDISKNLIFYGW